MVVTRRTFSAMLAGALATPRLAFAQAKDNCAFYSGVGGQLTHYEVDFGAATLAKRAAVTLPGGIQYAWPHPSRQILIRGDKQLAELGSRRCPDIRPTSTILRHSGSRRSVSSRGMAT